MDPSPQPAPSPPTSVTDPESSAEALARARAVRDQLPTRGLFAGQEWRIAPEPFRLGPVLWNELQGLGRVVLQFYRAADLLYRQSVSDKQPPWIARWLDQGKPAAQVELQRDPAFRNQLPRVLRPDLLITDHGLALTELDSVPGGIGLTGWLNATYASLGFDVVGGATGMIDGFNSIFGSAPRAHIVVSEEAATYRPEMEWIAGQLTPRGRPCQVHDGHPFEFSPGEAVYRFFELFDLDNVPVSAPLLAAARARQIQLTPPPKSQLEEKLWLALLWNGRLRDFWRRELGESFLNRLQAVVPYGWVMDPAPLPPHAALPRLELTEWRGLTALSQRERELILKVSGYSPRAWGARGVYLGSDLSATEWAEAVAHALASFEHSPCLLQRYEKPATVPARWADLETGRVVPMPARVRLCPYYFVAGDREQARASLGGVLATLCPADKKIIHGMKEAILAPCMP